MKYRNFEAGLSILKKLSGIAITLAIVLTLSACATCPQNNTPKGFVHLTDVVPDAILEIRYYSTYNFVGDRIYGY